MYTSPQQLFLDNVLYGEIGKVTYSLIHIHTLAISL